MIHVTITIHNATLVKHSNMQHNMYIHTLMTFYTLQVYNDFWRTNLIEIAIWLKHNQIICLAGLTFAFTGSCIHKPAKMLAANGTIFPLTLIVAEFRQTKQLKSNFKASIVNISTAMYSVDVSISCLCELIVFLTFFHTKTKETM